MAEHRELAEYENLSDQVKMTAGGLRQDGFGDAPLFRCLVVENEDEEKRAAGPRLVGYALSFFTYSTWEGRALYLEDLYVMPEYRGRGIGSRLFAAVAEIMQSVAVQPIPVGQAVSLTYINLNEWSSGICDCCQDMGICCCGFWCLPCFQCKTVSDFGECLCLPLLDPGSCCGYLGASINCPPISMTMRASIRERYRIRGSICSDCCMLYCCFSCSWCQMAREIKKHKQPVNFVTAQTTIVTGPMAPHPYQAYPPTTY
ncbi:uncharacterized protein [Ranitomeya imitator]|uniref:uncharacterized protein isoform X3 n=1 Tax=Ranitomeya imitator TaxID=111125 RepID=UPI0037E8AC46